MSCAERSEVMEENARKNTFYYLFFSVVSVSSVAYFLESLQGEAACTASPFYRSAQTGAIR